VASLLPYDTFVSHQCHLSYHSPLLAVLFSTTQTPTGGRKSGTFLLGQLEVAESLPPNFLQQAKKAQILSGGGRVSTTESPIGGRNPGTVFFGTRGVYDFLPHILKWWQKNGHAFQNCGRFSGSEPQESLRNVQFSAWGGGKSGTFSKRAAENHTPDQVRVVEFQAP
jgi:hypothetical protein